MNNTDTDTSTRINVYSFASDPTKQEPTGSCDLSKITTITKSITCQDFELTGQCEHQPVCNATGSCFHKVDDVWQIT